MGMVLIFWVICLIAGTVLAGERKIGTGTGFLVCLLFGIIGLIIVLASPKISEIQAEKEAIANAAIKNREPVPNVDDLMKYATLLDKGLLTKEEFDKEKAKLLKYFS